METTLNLTKTVTTTATTTATLSLLHIRRLATSPSPPPPRFLLTRRLSSAATISLLSFPRHLRPHAPHIRSLSRSAAACGGGSGGVDDGDGGGGGGGDGFDSGVTKVAAVDDAASVSLDAIVLDVGGMTCGGCAAKVKKILENQPQVSSATVNLATETAIVLPATEAKVVPNWRQELGELLAKHLTNCGFETNPRGQGDIEGEIPF
ncbi:hypothetical protein vseg_006981 [Gypsophila vaccaria]